MDETEFATAIQQPKPHAQCAAAAPPAKTIGPQEVLEEGIAILGGELESRIMTNCP